MKAKWLIESGDLEGENWETIVKYLKATGREVNRCNYIPFSDTFVKNPYGEEDCVVVFGSLGLCRLVNKYHKWVPGVWCDFEALKCSNYLAHLGEFSIQKRYGFYPLAEVNRNKDMLYDLYGEDTHIFIRPDDNYKSFNGELVAIEHWDACWRRIKCYEPAANLMAMVSQPSKIVNEWRFIIVDKLAVTGSQYRKNREVVLDGNYDENARVFAEKVAAKWQPHSVFSLDVCQTDDGEFHLMELGSVNGAGLYCCDLPKLVEAVDAVAVREWNEVYAPL